MELLGAVFTCQVSPALTVVWLINDTNLNDIPQQDAIRHSCRITSNNGTSLEELTVRAGIQYNGSSITCQVLNTDMNATA